VASYTFTNVQANHTIEASFSAIPPGQNLVANPSFESGIQGWIPYEDAKIYWRSGIAPADARTGTKSLEVRGDDASNGADDNKKGVPQVAGAGVRYRFQAWVKAVHPSSNGKVRIRAYEYTGSGQIGSTMYSPESTLTTTRWKLLTAFLTTQRSNSALRMRVTTTSDDQTFLIDDVSIEVVGSTALAQQDIESDVAPVLEFARPTVYPNPARGGATLALSLSNPGALKAEVYDVAGRLIRVLADEARATAGTHRFALERRATKLGAGIYFYRAEFEGVLHRGRFVILE
jgi:hypothetical protein